MNSDLSQNFLVQDNDALLDVFDVPLEYTYQDTLHWRETPAIARRRAEKKRLGEIRRRAKVYWDDLQKQEAQRARDEQAQIDKAKAENMERKRALWREKRKFIVAAEAEDRASRAKAWKQTETFLKEKEKQKHEGRLEFLRCLKEEEDKLDVLDLPYLARLRNLKYDTWGGREWYKAPQPPKMKK